LAAGIFPTVEEAQSRMCPGHIVYQPRPESAAVYEKLYKLYRKVYFAFGDDTSVPQTLSYVLPQLREIAGSVRQTNG
jgi:L-ribulokinase